MKRFALYLLLLALLPASALAQVLAPEYTVREWSIHDQKAVFATVESRNVVPARVRINGTIATLSVREGDEVKQGQVLGVVADRKIALQIGGLDSRIAATDAQITQSRTELGRVKALVPSGSASQSSLDKAQSAYDVAFNSRKALVAEREVLSRQIAEGRVLAPVTGRVLSVPVTAGTVVMPGEALATVAEGDFVLRLEIPERHARYVHKGDTVTLDAPEVSAAAAPTGTIVKVYPEINDGRVRADASVKGIGDYFVGERVRVWIAVDSRRAIAVPAGYVAHRFGMDFVRVKTPSGEMIEAPVRLGQTTPEGPEILSGLKAGDVVVRP